MDEVINELAHTVLDDDGRLRFMQVGGDFRQLGKAEWCTRYPDLGDRFEERDPADGELLVDAGIWTNTIGWVDWSGEDDEHQVRDMTTEACRRLGLPDPAIPVDISEEALTGLSDRAQRGHFIPALLKAVDAHLARTGLRLLGGSRWTRTSSTSRPSRARSSRLLPAATATA